MPTRTQLKRYKRFAKITGTNIRITDHKAFTHDIETYSQRNRHFKRGDRSINNNLTRLNTDNTSKTVIYGQSSLFYREVPLNQDIPKVERTGNLLKTEPKQFIAMTGTIPFENRQLFELHYFYEYIAFTKAPGRPVRFLRLRPFNDNPEDIKELLRYHDRDTVHELLEFVGKAYGDDAVETIKATDAYKVL